MSGWWLAGYTVAVAMMAAGAGLLLMAALCAAAGSDRTAAEDAAWERFRRALGDTDE